MMHVALLCLIVQTVKELCHIKHRKSTGGKYLCLSSGEQSASVRSGKKSDLGSQRAYIIDPASVYSLAVIQQPSADHILLKFIKSIVDNGGVVFILLVKCCMHLVVYGKKGSIAHELIIGIHCSPDLFDSHILYCLEKIVRDILALEGDLFLTDLGHYGIDEANDLLVDLVACHDGIEHGLVVDFIRSGFDHDDLVGAADHGQLQVVILVLLMSRIDDDLSVNESDRYACDRSVPRDIGDRDRDG